MNEIAFTKVDLPFGWLGNMSNFPIRYEGLLYKNSEALFKCLRFEGFPEIQKKIFIQKSPMAAKMIAKKYKSILSDNGYHFFGAQDVKLMEKVLFEKIRNHPRLKKMLQDTGDSRIIEDCTKRKGGSGKFWGACLENGEWVGENMLGKLWMKIRDDLKQE